MPTNYCPSCGSANSYTTEKPNFCAKCGKGFDFSSAASSILSRMSSAKAGKKRATSVLVDEEDEYEEDEPVRGSGRIPRKIQMDFTVEDPRQSLESVANEQKMGDFFGRETKKKINKKQWRKDFEKRMNNTTRIEIGGDEE